MQTVIVISFFAGLLLVQLFFWAVLLRVGLRWVKASNVSRRRVVATVLCTLAFNLIMFIVYSLFTPKGPEALAVHIGVCVIIVCGPISIVMQVFNISFGRAVRAWLPTLVSPAVFVAFALLVVRPYVFKTFTPAMMSMAPTLLPGHRAGKCNQCGETAYVGVVTYSDGSRQMSGPGICKTNFHVEYQNTYDSRVFSSDRFLVAKYLKPQRWDLIVFKSPEKPERIYIKRLVGLPGEEITIRDGKVYANGKPLTPPESIRRIEYASDMNLPQGAMWGAPDNPAKLADDEYFVLGDFSMRSFDSRIWEKGAAGRSPFAVPESHLRGVVTHIYWPMSRWRAFR